MEEEKRVCLCCGKNISTKPAIAKYCSRACGVTFWRQNNVEHISTYLHNKYIKNRETILQQDKDWIKANPELSRERNHKRYVDNKDNILKRQKIYRNTKENKKAASIYAAGYYKKHQSELCGRQFIRNRDDVLNLKDPYIKRRISDTTFTGIEINSEMIKTKRSLLLLHRQLKSSKL